MSRFCPRCADAGYRIAVADPNSRLHIAKIILAPLVAAVGASLLKPEHAAGTFFVDAAVVVLIIAGAGITIFEVVREPKRATQMCSFHTWLAEGAKVSWDEYRKALGRSKCTHPPGTAMKVEAALAG